MSSYIVSPSSTSDRFNPPDNLYRQYYCPQMFDSKGRRKRIEQFESEVLDWTRNAISEGENFIKSQRGFEGIENAIDTLISVGKSTNALESETLSAVKINEIKRDIWDNAAILSNIKPSWTYEANSSRETSWKQHAKILNGLSTDWYETNFISDRIRAMNQWAFTSGTGYLELYYDPDVGERGGELVGRVHGWANVFPVGIDGDFDLQNAYACIIKHEVDIRKLWRRYPHKAHQLLPDRQEPSFFRKVASAITGNEDIGTLFSDTRQSKNTSPTIDVYYIYVDDFSWNPTDTEVLMGQASWAYSVPAVKNQFQIGYNSDGSIKTKIADYHDAKLYPNKRLIICTRNCILYDGPSRYWHGKYPVVKYSPDSWVWSYLGYSLVAQVVSLNDSLTNMLRMMEDSLKLQLDPPSMIDEQTPPNLAKQSLRIPGMKLRGRVQAGDFIKPIVRDYKPSGEHFNYLKLIVENIARQLGTPDLRSLQQAKQVPGGDSMEKYFAQAGSIVTDMSRSMDRPLWELADMNRYNFYQFYDLPRRLQILGYEGLTEDDLDYDPMNMIPSNLPGESSMQVAGVEEFFASTRMQRARIHVRNFSTKIERNSAHEMTAMQNKLMKLQATKINPANGIISPETIAKEVGIKNWGSLKGDTELEKIADYLDIQTKLQLRKMLQEASVQAMIQQAMQGQTPEGQAAQAMQDLAGAAKGASTEIGQAQPGRPPEFQGNPTLEQKDSEGRTTITSSNNG